jgi:CysZ protein
MIRAFSRAFGQLPEPELRRVLGLSLAIALLVFIALWVASYYLLKYTDFFHYEIFGTDVGAALVDTLGGLAVVALTWFLFPAVVTLVVGFFLDGAAAAVEARHYPALGPARDQSIGEVLAITLKFAVVSIVLNLLALPIFLILLFIPPLNFFVFYGLNGYLLGREYYELVAHRRLDPPVARRLRRAFGGQIFVAGVVIAIMMSVPILNLIAPIVGTAALVHLVQRWRTGTL